MLPDTLDLATIRVAYASGDCTPAVLIASLYSKFVAAGDIFLFLAPLDVLLQRCTELECQPEAERGRLWGVPFGIKDNVDILGMPTTAACPAFSYMPTRDAPAVAALLAAGAPPYGHSRTLPLRPQAKHPALPPPPDNDSPPLPCPPTKPRKPKPRH